MDRTQTVPSPIYHLALRGEWADAVVGGEGYRRSTLGKSLAEEGFIHCSFADQVRTVADMVYRGRDDVVLLSIDSSLLQSPVRVEDVGGAGQAFPHIYGPLPVPAVVGASPVPLGADGRLDLDGLVDPRDDGTPPGA
ncbi:MAG: DUF952 domain-containing protein [Acidimicrobiales bacterium]